MTLQQRTPLQRWDRAGLYDPEAPPSKSYVNFAAFASVRHALLAAVSPLRQPCYNCGSHHSPNSPLTQSKEACVLVELSESEPCSSGASGDIASL